MKRLKSNTPKWTKYEKHQEPRNKVPEEDSESKEGFVIKSRIKSSITLEDSFLARVPLKDTHRVVFNFKNHHVNVKSLFDSTSVFLDYFGLKII